MKHFMHRRVYITFHCSGYHSTSVVKTSGVSVCLHVLLSFSVVYPADQLEGNNVLPTTTAAATSTATFTAPPTSGSGGTGTGGGGGGSASSGAGQATALFPCLVYYPGSQNYSLIWVPMDGSNPIVSGANILSGSGTLTIPTQVNTGCFLTDRWNFSSQFCCFIPL